MSISTKDCKEFLVNFFKLTPDLIVEIYGGDDGKAVLRDALNERNWKRKSKCKPQSENSRIQKVVCEVFESGKPYPQGPIYARPKEIPTSSIAYEREFILNPDIYDGAVSYLVLEAHDGTLYLGEYVGD